MTALSTAETALRRAPDDPGVPVTVSGAEAAALVAELAKLRHLGDELESAARDLATESCECDDLANPSEVETTALTACRAWREGRKSESAEVPDV